MQAAFKKTVSGGKAQIDSTLTPDEVKNRLLFWSTKLNGFG
jgi:hypothetical protein